MFDVDLVQIDGGHLNESQNSKIKGQNDRAKMKKQAAVSG